MSNLNLQINTIAFADSTPSNNPMLRQFDLTYKLMSLQVKNPEQRPYSIPPGGSQVIYDGTRSTSIDGTTEFDVSKPYLDKDTYRFTWNGNGTDPAFRTDRLIGLTLSSQFSVTVSGPVVTFTVTAGPFITTSIQVGDILMLKDGAGASATNQGRFSVIAKTSTSISVQNLNGAAETFAVLDTAKMLVYSNGGSDNKIQIGDKVLLSAGFSSASFGVYELTEVTPSWFEVNIGTPGGLPLETSIIPTATGMVFYKAIKQFLLLAAQQKVTAKFNDEATSTVLVEPIEAANPERPGLLIKNGSFYKLTVVNSGIETANLIVATAE